MHIKDFDPYDFSKKVVSGVPVYYKNLPWAPCIHIRFTFSVGAFGDPKNREGLAHFLEHVIGNGSSLLPDKKAVREFSRLYMLNTKNASTSYHWTSYTGKCLPENFEKVISAMEDYIFRPFLRVEDVEHERKVITQEAWGVYKNEKYLNYGKEYSKNVYHGHQRERILSPLGWPDTIDKITQKDISDFHKKNYVKENVSVFLVGAIDEKKIAPLTKTFKKIPSGKKSKIIEGKISKPKKLRFERIAEEIGDPKKQLEYTISRALNKVSDKESDAGDQLSSLLYDILFERLRTELSLCYGVSVGWRKYKSYSEFGISVETSEDKLALVETEIQSVIKEINEGKWESRFDTLHRLVLDQIRSNERASGDIVYNASSDIVANNKIRTLKEILRNVERITYKDVQKLAQKIFDPKNTFTEVIFPSKK